MTAEVRLVSESLEVVVLPELGARLHRLRVHGADVLRHPPRVDAHRDDPFFWGAYNMAPWCNRLEAAPVEVAGQLVDLPANFRDGTAIHGQVYEAAWAVQTDGSFAVRGGGEGWPWPYLAELLVEPDTEVLRLTQRLTNLAASPMPGGIGIHPWFLKPLEVGIHAPLAYPSNNDSPPQPEPVSGALDLRNRRDMPSGLDATWAHADEQAVELAWPELGLSASMRAVASAGRRRVDLHVVAASPGEVDAVAIEPQTHAPQGLRRLLGGEPGGLTMLDPGETLSLITELSFERYAPPGR